MLVAKTGNVSQKRQSFEPKRDDSTKTNDLTKKTDSAVQKQFDAKKAQKEESPTAPPPKVRTEREIRTLINTLSNSSIDATQIGLSLDMIRSYRNSDGESFVFRALAAWVDAKHIPFSRLFDMRLYPLTQQEFVGIAPHLLQPVDLRGCTTLTSEQRQAFLAACSPTVRNSVQE